MSTHSLNKTNLLGKTKAELADFFKEIGEPVFRATQVLKWIHVEGETSFANMTNLSKTLRAKLEDVAEVVPPRITHESIAKDGTIKWLFHTDTENAIEAVYIPEPGRATLCISSQVGCSLNCKFCYTAQQGFQRNLSAHEIIGQVWTAWFKLKAQNMLKGNRPITNIVFMGMGEPLLNYDNVSSTLSLLLDNNAYNLSKRRVTVSTSGVVPKIDKLHQDHDVALALSLHAPNDPLREQIVPLNKKYNIQTLLDACRRYTERDHKMHITMEYVMLKDVNDSIKHAAELVKILSTVSCKVNLIPFNPFPGAPYECSSNNAIHRFQNHLMENGIMSFIRRARGDDILAACGQLAGQVKDKTKRSLRLKVLPVTLEKTATV